MISFAGFMINTSVRLERLSKTLSIKEVEDAVLGFRNCNSSV